MTPKEKAEELILKFCKQIGTYNNKLVTETAKDCAKVCVDEILGYLGTDGYPTEVIFWEQVKTQIKKL